MALISPYSWKDLIAQHEVPFSNKSEAKKGRETEKKTANEQICLREDMSTDTLSRKI